MPRIAQAGEDLTGKVCTCSLGRVGVVVGFKPITFANGAVKLCWHGMGFDGNGLWATTKDPEGGIVVLAESLALYVEQVARRPNNFSYGKAAVHLG